MFVLSCLQARPSKLGTTTFGASYPSGWAYRWRLREVSQNRVRLHLRDAARKLDFKTCLTADAEDLIASAKCVAPTRSRT